MSYDINNIVPINVSISPTGLGTANFGSATLFAPESELPVGFDTDTRRVYTSLSDLSVDFASTTETYQAASKWLGGTPSMNELTVYGVDSTDADWATTLNKARNEFWWFYTFVTADVYASVTDATEVATWCNDNSSWFQNCQTGANSTAIRDISDDTDIATAFTTSGYRFAGTLAHATDPYAGIALCKLFAKVNYNVTNSTITGEGKVLSGVAGEDLTGTAYAAMNLPTKKCQFYTRVENKGSVDLGRVINTWSHSSFGEFMDDVINLEAFVNAIGVQLYNTVFNQPTKLGQDVVGQSVLIGAAKAICELYIRNGYLGPRNYTDPDDGIEKYTEGYEILTQPEEILNLTDAQRDDRESAPLRIRVFRKGAIHSVPVDISVY
ncbi:MAG: hypothetical protein Tp118SUR00d2C21406351_27 [Prokaryotic dsDNA virus sp.]|nr:MAG: hypothetical protein Tp118SUR00d2C21406351_27 [Prokaryotic dsDNA virus sp.]|tara:strand:- start:19570 stop:20712 length:1143 start_codon:yes stop_codon:yes gene_type:complete